MYRAAMCLLAALASYLWWPLPGESKLRRDGCVRHTTNKEYVQDDVVSRNVAKNHRYLQCFRAIVTMRLVITISTPSNNVRMHSVGDSAHVYIAGG